MSGLPALAIAPIVKPGEGLRPSNAPKAPLIADELRISLIGWGDNYPDAGGKGHLLTFSSKRRNSRRSHQTTNQEAAAPPEPTACSPVNFTTLNGLLHR